jgi:hypothetical protein
VLRVHASVPFHRRSGCIIVLMNLFISPLIASVVPSLYGAHTKENKTHTRIVISFVREKELNKLPHHYLPGKKDIFQRISLARRCGFFLNFLSADKRITHSTVACHKLRLCGGVLVWKIFLLLGHVRK